MTGDETCAEGALAAGCLFLGHPITPATKIAEHMSERRPDIGSTFIQMEDEIITLAAVRAVSRAGQKSMSATSGPSFSLMMKNLGRYRSATRHCSNKWIGIDAAAGYKRHGDLAQLSVGGVGDPGIYDMSPASEFSRDPSAVGCSCMTGLRKLRYRARTHTLKMNSTMLMPMNALRYWATRGLLKDSG